MRMHECYSVQNAHELEQIYHGGWTSIIWDNSFQVQRCARRPSPLLSWACDCASDFSTTFGNCCLGNCKFSLWDSDRRLTEVAKCSDVALCTMDLCMQAGMRAAGRRTLKSTSTIACDMPCSLASCIWDFSTMLGERSCLQGAKM